MKRPDSNEPDSMSVITRKLLRFAQYPDGWHFGRGFAPPPDRIHAALQLCKRLSLSGLDSLDVFPDVDGEIEIVAYQDEYDLELTLKQDGSYTLNCVFLDEEIFNSQIHTEDVLNLVLAAFAEKLCPQYYAFCTPISLTEQSTDTEAQSSNRPVTGQGFPSSSTNVSSTKNWDYVSTSGIFMQNSIPRFTGFFPRMSQTDLYMVTNHPTQEMSVTET